MGAVLLLLRLSVSESALFKKTLEIHSVSRGKFWLLITRRKLFLKYLKLILIGLPTFLIVGVMVTGAPEFGKQFNMKEIPNAGTAVAVYYICTSTTLEKNFPGTNIHTTGLDYSEMNINLLKKNYAGTISGITASFYNLPVQTKNSDIIISNEGFHWQPPYAMSKMMFSYLDSPEKENYDRFALQNLETAFRNVYGSLKTGGIGVFQFGHKGQIKKLWDLVYDIFNEDAFKEYVRKINFPVYHPTVEHILSALIIAGFLRENMEIDAYTQDLMEESPSAVTAFFRAFSQPGLSQYLPPDILSHFYNRMEDRFNKMNMVEFRKNLLHRTLIKVRKGAL